MRNGNGEWGWGMGKTWNGKGEWEKRGTGSGNGKNVELESGGVHGLTVISRDMIETRHGVLLGGDIQRKREDCESQSIS